MANKTKTQIIQIIEDAFKEKIPPKAKSIAYKTDWDYECITSDLSPYVTPCSKKDRELAEPSFKVLEYNHSALSVLKPKAYHYFLPYYLIFSLTKPDSNLSESTLFNLMESDINSSRWKKRFKHFSYSEKRAVCVYLKYMRAQDEYSLFYGRFGESLEFWCGSKKYRREKPKLRFPFWE